MIQGFIEPVFRLHAYTDFRNEMKNKFFNPYFFCQSMSADHRLGRIYDKYGHDFQRYSDPKSYILGFSRKTKKKTPKRNRRNRNLAMKKKKKTEFHYESDKIEYKYVYTNRNRTNNTGIIISALIRMMETVARASNKLLQSISKLDLNYETNCRCTIIAPNQLFCQKYSCSRKGKAVYTYLGPKMYCFSKNGKVLLYPSKRKKKLKNLNIGEKIYSFYNGKYIEDEIIGFLHYNEQVETDFLQIFYEYNNKTNILEITPDHLIISDNNIAIFAKELRENSLIFVENQFVKIKKITKIRLKGVFAPLTKTGRLLVNGVLVSNYAYFNSERLSHLAFAFYRSMYEFGFGNQKSLEIFTKSLIYVYELLKKIGLKI